MKILGNSRSRAPCGGFTLIELLVAAAITLLLAGLLVALASNVLTTWNRASGGLTAASQAGVIMEQLSQDLEAAVMRSDSLVWFAATVQHDQSGAGDAGMTDEDWSATSKPRGGASIQLVPPSGRWEDARCGQAGMWLRFFTTQPDANDSAAN
ncbi:MAG: prepilin-type N-terminal cleavage/methylation domain-containing protein [Opitutaceae bacterium]|nr:prepilin-type N-terminal cleavage/methylation domain-containing protein [Opitutaceae bacterium]